MIRNYIKVAWRSISNNKAFTVISVAGLSIGLACCMLILLYINDETSFDRFHKNAGRVYRVVSIMHDSQNGEHRLGSSANPVGPAIQREIPGVKDYVRIADGEAIVKLNDQFVHETIHYCDTNFFSVFTFPLLYGNASSVLTNMNSVVLTRQKAEKYFGASNPVGKQLSIKIDSTFKTFVVTGVSEDVPQNSSIQFGLVLSYSYYAKSLPDQGHSWLDFNLNTFVLLQPNSSPMKIEAKFPPLVSRYVGKKLNDINKNSHNDLSLNFHLQNIKDVHLDATLEDSGGFNTSKPVYSYILGGIAIFILVISCINFVNLSIGISLKRAKEIGIRKVIGGLRKQLIIQFICESFLLCSFAFVLALMLVKTALPLFSRLSNKQLQFNYMFTNYQLIIAFVALLLITSLGAGCYPAFFVSRFKPVDVLYSKVQLTGKNIFSKYLIIIQFSLAIFLVTITIIFQSQFNFLIKRNLGYDDKNIVRVKLPAGETNAAAFKIEILKNKGVISASNSSGGLYIDGVKADGKDVSTAILRIDEDYLTVLHIPIVVGRGFDRSFPADRLGAIVINETFAKQAGWKNPIGKLISMGNDQSTRLTVVGMIKDYNFQSLREKIMPLMLHCGAVGQTSGEVLIKLNPVDIPQTLAFIRSTFKQFKFLTPFEYSFLDIENAKQYESERQWNSIIAYASLSSIIISCLGLFGLSALSVARRAKEISVRKILGASASGLAGLISKEFLKLIFIAFAISIPFAWYSANRWLENFSNRIHISWWMFIAAGSTALLIALVTISFQAIKAALMNPVLSLRSE